MGTGRSRERAVAVKLEELAGEHIEVLHDRRLRHPDGRLSRANIDHIAISASGIWVIDTKTHEGALEVRRSGGLLRPLVEQLWINGRNRTNLGDGLHSQVQAVRHQLVDVEADLPVHGALCFVGTDLLWLGSSSIQGVHLLGRRSLAKRLRSEGDLDQEARAAIAAFLDVRFPSAL